MSQAIRQLVTSFPGLSSDSRVEAAAAQLEHATPQEALGWAFEQFGEGVTIATGFGAEGVVMIDMAVKINPNPSVFFLDTGLLFEETYKLRDRLEDQYGIEIRPFQAGLTPAAQGQIYGARLWDTDPDLCCRMRKLEPLSRALAGRDAWITAIRRDQTAARAAARVVEWDHRWQLVKINPLVRWTKREVWNYILRNNVPYNPLHDAGYPSIGCTHCTRAVRAGEDDRAGRWAGRAKSECGLHVAADTVASERQGATFAV